MLMSLSGTDYALNDHEVLSQYSRYTIASKILRCYSYPESLLDCYIVPNLLPCLKLHL